MFYCTPHLFHVSFISYNYFSECHHENEIRLRDPIRCRECGYRIMYKKRTKRCILFSNCFCGIKIRMNTYLLCTSMCTLFSNKLKIVAVKKFNAFLNDDTSKNYGKGEAWIQIELKVYARGAYLIDISNSSPAHSLVFFCLRVCFLATFFSYLFPYF